MVTSGLNPETIDKYRQVSIFSHTHQHFLGECLTLEVTNDNFHGVHRLELYIVAF